MQFAARGAQSASWHITGLANNDRRRAAGCGGRSKTGERVRTRRATQDHRRRSAQGQRRLQPARLAADARPVHRRIGRAARRLLDQGFRDAGPGARQGQSLLRAADARSAQDPRRVRLAAGRRPQCRRARDVRQVCDFTAPRSAGARRRRPAAGRPARTADRRLSGQRRGVPHVPSRHQRSHAPLQVADPQDAHQGHRPVRVRGRTRRSRRLSRSAGAARLGRHAGCRRLRNAIRPRMDSTRRPSPR